MHSILLSSSAAPSQSVSGCPFPFRSTISIGISSTIRFLPALTFKCICITPFTQVSQPQIRTTWGKLFGAFANFALSQNNFIIFRGHSHGGRTQLLLNWQNLAAVFSASCPCPASPLNAHIANATKQLLSAPFGEERDLGIGTMYAACGIPLLSSFAPGVYLQELNAFGTLPMALHVPSVGCRASSGA